MKTTLTLMLVQGCLGAFDTLWFHEFKLRLPQAAAANKELRLHACRDFIYAVVFGSLAWATHNGFYAWALCGVLIAEIIITLQDFIEEDRSRKVPAGERVMHALMGITYGAILTSLWPQITTWSKLPTGFAASSHGTMSWVLTALAVGVLISGMRDRIAATRGPGRRGSVKAKGV